MNTEASAGLFQFQKVRLKVRRVLEFTPVRFKFQFQKVQLKANL